MATTIYLHVGLPKSGTTYVQAVLGANQERLARDAGVLFPGESWGDHVRAARDVLNFPVDERSRGAWASLLEEVREYDGRAGIISMEWLGSAGPPVLRRIFATLEDFEVHAVFTARDLARTVPGAWQEFCQNRDTFTWHEFVESITSPTSQLTDAGSIFWNQQDLTRQIARWRDHVPAERISVVTVQPSGAPAQLLWDRFCEAVGVEGPSTYDNSGGGKNSSLGLQSAELMRRINHKADAARMAQVDYLTVLKERLAKKVLSRRKPSEGKVGIPASLDEWMLEQQRRQVEAVRQSGVRLVGDLDDLVNTDLPRGDDPDACDCDELLDAATDGLVGMAEHSARDLTRITELNHQLREARRRESQAHDERDAAQHEVAALRNQLEAMEGRRFGAYAKGRVVAASRSSDRVMAARRAWWKAADTYRAKFR